MALQHMPRLCFEDREEGVGASSNQSYSRGYIFYWYAAAWLNRPVVLGEL